MTPPCPPINWSPNSGQFVDEVSSGPLDAIFISYHYIISALSQVALCFLGQLGAVMYLHLRPWWTPVDPANPEQEITVNFDTTTIFVISAFQYISIATVFSSGPPFRAPLYKNQLYSLALLLLSATTILLVLNPIPVLSNFFSLLLPFPAEPDALPFQWMLLIFIMVTCQIQLLTHHCPTIVIL